VAVRIMVAPMAGSIRQELNRVGRALSRLKGQPSCRCAMWQRKNDSRHRAVTHRQTRAAPS
jgi:hypothetical protein